MAKNIQILLWNANGLENRKDELQATLDINKIDICLVSETHFKIGTKYKLRGYKTYHTPHPHNAARGGAAVIIKEGVKHDEDEEYQSCEIQAKSVNIKISTGQITVTAAYCSPSYRLKQNNFECLLRKFGNKFIIGGDFNAKNKSWGSRLTNTRGRELLESIKKTNANYHSTGNPTYWPTDRNKIPDVVDFFITKNISSNTTQVKEGPDLDSDHSSVLLTLGNKIIMKEHNPRLVNKLTDWIYFRYLIDECIELSTTINTIEQLESEVQSFTLAIQKAAWAATPELNSKVKRNVYPKEVCDIISEKRRARKRWQLTRAPSDKNRLNSLNNKLRKKIAEFKNASMERYLTNLTNDASTEYSLWKATKKIKRPTTYIPPVKNSSGNWAKTNKQKADLFAEHLENVFQPYDDNDNSQQMEEMCEDERSIPAVTSREIAKEIKEKINPKKAPGFDLITGEILKKLPKKGMKKMAQIINAAFRLRYVPSMWKVAEVIMVPKPGKLPSEVTSYRPISLLPILSKLFEKILLKRLHPILEEKTLIPNHQFGFRNKYSTIDQVHRITNIIEKALEEKQICSTIFLDVTQAFDKVWHKGLVRKLQKYLPKQYSEILESYIMQRLFRIKQEDEYSALKHIKAGVPQGSVLGPVLFLLYTNDLPQNEETTVATFADDTAVLAVGKTLQEVTEKLQRTVNDISNWTNKWQIKLNELKSVHVNFTNKHVQHIPVYINNKMVQHSNSAKYLGLTLDAKLRWKTHVKKKRDELNLRYIKIYWLIGRYSCLSIHNKLLLYKQILKPIWTYGLQLWGCTSKSNLQSIQCFQNKVLRNIVNAPWYVRNADLHRDLKIEMVEDEVRKVARRHEFRLRNHANLEVVQLLNNTNLVRRLRRVKPFELVN